VCEGFFYVPLEFARDIDWTVQFRVAFDSKIFHFRGCERLFPAARNVKEKRHMATAPLRILLVKGSHADPICLSTILAEEEGITYELVVAEQLAHGLEQVGGGGIDVVLLDLTTISVSPCSEIVAAFNRATPRVPILVVTDVENDNDSLEAVRAGAQDCLLKSRLAGHWLWRTIRYAVERQVLEEQLRRSQKTQAIGQLAAGIAHDFNNMLQVINGRSQLALDTLQPGDALHNHLTQILKTGQRAAVLTQQLLAFSRRQILRTELLDLNAVVMGLEQLLRDTLPETLTLNLLLDPAIKSIRADRGQLEQVLLNLVINARDAMPKGGTLMIQTKPVLPGEQLTVERKSSSRFYVHDSEILNTRIKADKPYVLLIVRDTGGGMDAATLSRAFEPFFTTKEQGKGTGLGLATVYGIIRQSGGHIRIDSKPGKGTHVKIYLPNVEGTPLLSHSSNSLLPEFRGGETILLVEDEVEVRELIGEVLLAQGYTVLFCADGIQALELCKNYPGEIHLLLTDIILPGICGPKLAEAVQAARPKALELFMSGHFGNEAGEQKLAERGARYIPKPFTIKNLLRKVRETLDCAI